MEYSLLSRGLAAILVASLHWGAPGVANSEPGQKHVDDKGRRLQAAADQKRIREVVEMLASTNKAPAVDRPYLDVPKNYDKRAQAIVYLAIRQLLSEGDAAFDILIEHFDDKRYSYSFESVNVQENENVGEVCQDIMRRILNCYDFEIHLITRDQYDLNADRGQKSLAEWWNENRHRQLWEIQVDRIDAAIRFMERVDRDKALSIHPNAAKLAPDVFEKLRNENIKSLQARRASITAAGEAYRPKSLEHYFSTMIELPWGKGRRFAE